MYLLKLYVPNVASNTFCAILRCLRLTYMNVLICTLIGGKINSEYLICAYVCMYLTIGKGQFAQKDHNRAKVASGSSTEQSCKQSCFFPFGFSRFDEAVEVMIVLVRPICRTSKPLSSFHVDLAV